MGKIVFLGDSVTASENVPLAQRWVQMVGLSAGYDAADIINAGVPGNNSAQLLARLQSDVLAISPSVVVMMFTVNDGANGVSLAIHEANYRNMIAQCKNAGCKVVLMSPPVYRQNVDTWAPWADKWRSLAGELNCPFVDIWRDYTGLWLTGGFVEKYVSSTDVVHQNASGNARIHLATLPTISVGGFVLGQTQQPGECPATLPELDLALADLQKKGATVQRLQRVIDAL